MANTDFGILLKTLLDKSGINSELEQVQKIVNKYTIDIMPELKTASLKNQMKAVSQEIANDFNKSFGTNLTGNDVFKAFENQAKQAEKAVKEEAKAIETARKEQESLANAMAKGRDQAELSRQAEEKRQQTAQSKAINKALEEEYNLRKKNNEEANKIQISTDVTKLTTDYQKFGVVSQEVENNLKELKLAQEAVVNAKGTDRLTTEIEKYNTALDKAKSSLKELTTTQVSMNQRTSQLTSMQEWMRKNKAATKLVGNEVNKLIEECKTCDAVRFNGIKNEFKELQVQAGKAGKLGNSLFGSLKDQVSKFVQWVSVARTTMAIGNALRNEIINIKELDTALVDLKKTTDATASELEDFYYSANDTAKQLGVSTEEVINATSSWSRLGYAIKDASTMAENSAILASISPEMNIEEATDGLVSALKAFKIEAEDSLDGVISKINIIGNTQAVDNNDIVDILTRSSSAMAEANNTLEETIALGTAATEITRDADAVGTMLKTVSMRIRGYDEELESYTDDLANLSGTIADLTKTTSTPGGISLFTDETKTTYKSTYQILKDISDIYDELDDKTQAQLLEALAGKRQGQAVAAIINNFDAAESSMNSMANSAGNAMKEMEIIYDSLDYKLNQTQETATGIAQNLFGREDMKLVVDTFNVFLGLLDKATEKLGLFGTVATGAGIFAGIKNIGRPKMFGLYKYADINMCSLGY